MSISNARANRPSVYGEQNRRVFMVQESEVALRAENDANGNPVYVARAQVGASTSESKWQIQKLTWDANNSITRAEWPQNAAGNPSADYEFVYDDRATYTYG